ncbi:Gx transporter family protein [Thiohalobacter thiocyanaticus]|uniref:Gx transporter family protein n=1 Tax=Thiohalobacter thiocyanaticus TaxID=585455 RepID=A0A426QKF1_9GAMM|nr:Gx transporter family protein [Thiohalobacter thiocyanaticus]RRQ22196.1 Gx transporter family protein [Thiohalobacter thiocyanaticus]
MPVETVTTRPEDHRIAWLAALAIAIHVLEAAIPSPVPGLKPGLANLVTLLALLAFGWRTAVWVSLLRVLVGSLILGSFLTPTFMLSLAGALASLLALGLGRALGRHWLGPLGLSLLAALGHISGQFLLAYALFIPHPGLWHLFPPLLTAALIFGILNGIIANLALQGVDRIGTPREGTASRT